MKKEKLFSIKTEIEGAQIEILRNIKKEKNQRNKNVCLANYNRMETILTKIEQILENGSGVIEECTEEAQAESSMEKPSTSTTKPGK